jgi:hypothetical protein
MWAGFTHFLRCSLADIALLTSPTSEVSLGFACTALWITFFAAALKHRKNKEKKYFFL